MSSVVVFFYHRIIFIIVFYFSIIVLYEDNRIILKELSRLLNSKNNWPLKNYFAEGVVHVMQRVSSPCLCLFQSDLRKLCCCFVVLFSSFKTSIPGIHCKGQTWILQSLLMSRRLLNWCTYFLGHLKGFILLPCSVWNFTW